MEHPASKYLPHHREGSRVFPAEHFCQLRQRRLKCQTSSVSSLVWVTNCWVISDPYSSLRSLKKLCQSLGQSQLGGSGTGSSRFLSGKLLMGPEPWLCPRSSCCPGATAAPPQHPGALQVLPKQDAMASSGKESPQGHYQVSFTSPIVTSSGKTQHTPSQSAHSIKYATQRTHYDHLKYNWDWKLNPGHKKHNNKWWIHPSQGQEWYLRRQIGKNQGNNILWVTHPEQSHRSRVSGWGPAPCSSSCCLRDTLKLCPGLRDNHHYPSFTGKLRHKEKNYLVQYPREKQWQSRFKTGSNFFHKIIFYKQRREWGSSSKFTLPDNWHNSARKKNMKNFFFSSYQLPFKISVISGENKTILENIKFPQEPSGSQHTSHPISCHPQTRNFPAGIFKDFSVLLKSW